MNRTEAIEILENWLSSSRRTEKRLGYINGWFYEEDEEAFRMAIEALNCSEIPTGSNLISRQDAIDAVMAEGRRVFTSECANAERIIYEEDAVEALSMLPSAEPKTGAWVRLEREENVYDLHGVPTWGVNYMCDKCGFITTAIQDHFEQYKFCPHCGKRLVIER